ncbi:hypothetical protein N0V90_006598 [Kalmusia sp. IMI 367209]|nr:hypothetical protein N0V90_006598 [Kalmusia sp. IMI 367209]
MSARGGASQGRARNQTRGGSSSLNRTGKRPSRVIVVPQEYQRQTLLRERERLINLWKTQTGCDVVIIGEGSRDMITKFELYGTGHKLDKVAEEVERWIRVAKNKSAETTAWAKIGAHIPKDWFQDLVQRQRDERREKFRGVIANDEKSNFPNLITVEWPEDLREQTPPVMPKDVFGVRLEALDPIRMDDEVFIQLVGLSKFEIRGATMTHVDLAEQHLLTAIEKSRIKLFNPTYQLCMMLDEREGIEVLFEKADTWWPNSTSHCIAPRLLPCGIMDEPGEFRQDILHPKHQGIIQRDFRRALDTIRYEKGYYDLSIRFGCLALRMPNPNKLLGTKHKKEEFLRTINSLTECVVKDWLFNDKDGDELLRRLKGATHLLEPTNPSTGYGDVPNTLAETLPTLRGSWVFKDPNVSGSSHTLSPNYVVQVHWTLDEDGLYEKDKISYYRLDQDCTDPKENMNIKLLELGESRAWQFSLLSMTPVNKTLAPTALRHFADQVRIKQNIGPGSKEPFTNFGDINASSKLITGRLDKVYTFGIKNSSYKVNVVAMWYPGKIVHVPCWGLHVCHSDWQSHLAELEHLQQGRVGQWGDTIRAFLPDDGLSSFHVDRDENTSMNNLRIDDERPQDGIRLLMTKLMELSKIISQSSGNTVQDPAIPVSPLNIMAN